MHSSYALASFVLDSAQADKLADFNDEGEQAREGICCARDLALASMRSTFHLVLCDQTSSEAAAAANAEAASGDAPMTVDSGASSAPVQDSPLSSTAAMTS